MTESLKNKIFVISIMIFLGVCLLLYFARGIIAPFLISAFIAYLIYPLIIVIQSFGYRRWVGIMIVAFCLIVVLVCMLNFFIPLLINEFERFKMNILNYYDCFSNYIDIIRHKMEIGLPIIKRYDISDIIITKTREFLFSQVQQIPVYIISIFSIFSIIILIPMLVLFMLLSGNKNINTMIALFPSDYIETILSVVYEINAVLGRYIRGQFIEAFFVGVMSIIFLSAFKVNFALIISIISGVLNIIPFLGPFIGLILALVVGLIQFQTFTIIIKIIIAYTIIQFLDNNFVQPLVVGHNINLGPVMIAFAILAGWQIFGFLGVIFAIPTIAILKTVLVMLIQKYKRAVV
ncbi:MAG: AI-2E family transporter [Endomicrobium sp.]|jgi:predicted PurR-regulated permease PerM|nr:AI-2E family transporter [Endomicrobium sp.]